MTNKEFFYWLNGYLSLNDNAITLEAREINIIRNHLELVKQVDKSLWKKNILLDELLNKLPHQEITTAASTLFKEKLIQLYSKAAFLNQE